MTDLQSLNALPVGNRPNAAVEEVVVKGEKKDDDGFTFFDFLDVINPLQHIPIVNTVYREITGDEIKAPAKMIGSAILGGPVGLAVAMVDSAIEDSTGKDIGSHAMALFKNDEAARDNGTAFASSTTAEISAGSATQAVAAAVTSAQATSAREFIPALSVATGTAQDVSFSSAAASFIEDGTKDPVQEEAEARTQETQTSIAAAAAAAPQGLVFMPLPGRQGAAYRPTPTTQTGDGFMPINRSGAASRPAANPAAAAAAMAQLQAQTAFPPGPFGGAAGGIGAMTGDRMDSLLEATRPQGDTGKMPAADPFAAARMIGEESAPTVVPAWFEAATSGALDKYKTMQAVP